MPTENDFSYFLPLSLQLQQLQLQQLQLQNYNSYNYNSYNYKTTTATTTAAPSNLFLIEAHRENEFVDNR